MHQNKFQFCPCCSYKRDLNIINITLIIGSIFLVESSIAVLHVILKAAGVSGTVFIEVLAEAVLDVIFPIADIQLPLVVVILSFAMLIAFMEFALIALPVLIGHDTSTIRLVVLDSTLINGAVWTIYCLDVARDGFAGAT